MRIQKIFLDAFGPFTDKTIDLSGGKEGLHIIYGQNEAGKSSALRAITQLFFGIPARSVDDFIHHKNLMRIGGSISDGSHTLIFMRRKGNTGTLLNRDDDEIMDESALQAFLGGMDRETFTVVFGLDHKHLVEGGRMIVEGEGNVGEALFAASAGLGNLRIVLEKLENEAGELFKPSGSKPRINSAINSLSEVRRNLREAQLRPTDWSDKDRELRHTIENRNNIEREILELQTKSNRLRRIKQASPLVTKYIELKEQLSLVADAPLLQEDFGEQFRALLSEETHTLHRIDEITKELAEIHKNIGNLTVNESILIHEAEIEELNKLYATNTKALSDSREKLKPDLHTLEEQAVEVLKLFRPSVGLNEVPSLKIKPALRQRITELGPQSETLKNRRNDAEADLLELRNKRASLMISLESLVSVPEPNELANTIQRVRRLGDIEDSLRNKQREESATEKEISNRISRLELWKGSMNVLETLPVPSSETIERFRDELDKLKNQLGVVIQSIKETEEELRKFKTQITTLKLDHDTPTEKVLDEYRNARNKCWLLVRREWENASPPGKINSEDIYNTIGQLGIPEKTMENLADTYESITRETDDISDRLRREAERVANLAQLEATKAGFQEKNKVLGADHAKIENEYEEVKRSWDELWKPLGIEPRSPREMAVWAQNQREIVKIIGGYRLTTAEMERISSDIKRYGDELSLVLETLGKPKRQDHESLAALLDRAGDTVSKFREIISKRAQIKENLSSIDTIDIPDAKRKVTESQKNLADWKIEWANAMNALGEDNNASPGEIYIIVQQIDKLVASYDKITELKKRINQIAENDRDFREKVKVLAKAVALEIVEMHEEQVSKNLYDELKNNRLSKTKSDSLNEQSDDAKKRFRKAEDALIAIREKLGDLCREANVNKAEELQPAWDRSEKRRKYEEEIERVNERLIELSQGHSLGEFIEMVKGEDIDALEPTLANLGEKINEYNAELINLSEKIGRIENELEQMDGKADCARLEEDAQLLLADISKHAEQYARLKISEKILARSIEQYRAKNQGPLLQRAGEIFSKLTIGSFDGLMNDFGDNEENILVGIRSGGKERVTVSGMSDGTVDQLYLALRIASLEQYLINHPPVPFILDDILINFDNERAAATLGVLADLSQHTQVIFFTHHRHISDIAKKKVVESLLFTSVL